MFLFLHKAYAEKKFIHIFKDRGKAHLSRKTLDLFHIMGFKFCHKQTVKIF
jgi:hypothetical protein